jgi:hypothetical protein
MLLRSKSSLRPATNLIESAIVYPLVFFLLLSMVIGAMGIFRYQEMASISRDAARYGSVHGYQYRRDAGWPLGTAGTSCSSPVDTTSSPYNVSPWTVMLWFQCTTTNTPPTDLSTDSWSQYIFDASVYQRTVLLDPSKLQMFVGYEPVQNQPYGPDNFPGARIVVCSKYQIFPEAIIWWQPQATYLTVSTSAMPITN